MLLCDYLSIMTKFKVMSSLALATFKIVLASVLDWILNISIAIQSSIEGTKERDPWNMGNFVRSTSESRVLNLCI